MRIFFISVCLSILVSGTASAGRGPFAAEVGREFESEDTLRITISHLEGRDDILLHRVIPVRLPAVKFDEIKSGMSPEITLYRGRLRREGRDGVRRAAADIRNGVLRVSFHGRRRGRFIQVTQRKPLGAARASFVPSFAVLPCGSTAASVIDSHSAHVPASMAASASLLLDVGIDADYEFFSEFGQDTASEVSSILNIVNGIYINQLGMEVALRDLNIYTSANQPYTTSAATELLQQFQSYNLTSPHLESSDVYHLLTGKSIQPQGMVGLSYVGSVCQNQGQYSFGFSSYYPGPIQPIIVAHEIGHSVGATHNTSTGIMIPNLSSNPRSFSPESIAEIENYVTAYGGCLHREVVSVKFARFSWSSKGRLRALLQADGPLSGTCRVSIYGSTRRSYLSEGVISGKARRLYTASVTVSEPEKRVSAAVPRSGGSVRTIYFRARIGCESQSGVSEIVSARVRTKTTRRFYEALKAALDR